LRVDAAERAGVFFELVDALLVTLDFLDGDDDLAGGLM
jgi:hypothetical protein